MVDSNMWQNIKGHKKQIETLKGYVSSGRMPHALIFAGPPGLGKKKTAVEYFKSLNCSSGDPCDSCPCCTKAANMSHPDLVLFEPPSSGGQVELMRNVLSGIGLKPFEAKYKLVIIDPAERLNSSSSNALLKSLEEPPDSTVFILITSNPNLLLPTIVSRCQMLRFSPADPVEGTGNLRDPAMARLASGAPGIMAASESEKLFEFRKGVVGLLTGGDPFELAAKFFANSQSVRDSVPLMLCVVESVARDLMLLDAGGEDLINGELLDIPKDSRRDVGEVLDAVGELRRAERANVVLKAAFCELFIKIRKLSR